MDAYNKNSERAQVCKLRTECELGCRRCKFLDYCIEKGCVKDERYKRIVAKRTTERS